MTTPQLLPIELRKEFLVVSFRDAYNMRNIFHNYGHSDSPLFNAINPFLHIKSGCPRRYELNTHCFLWNVQERGYPNLCKREITLNVPC